MLALNENWYFLGAAYVDVGIEPFSLQCVDWCGLVYKKGKPDSDSEWICSYRIGQYDEEGKIKKLWFHTKAPAEKSKEDVLTSFEIMSDNISKLVGRSRVFVKIDGGGNKAMEELATQPWLRFVFKRG